MQEMSVSLQRGKKCATIKTTDLPACLPACHDLKISCRDKLEIKEER